MQLIKDLITWAVPIKRLSSVVKPLTDSLCRTAAFTTFGRNIYIKYSDGKSFFYKLRMDKKD